MKLIFNNEIEYFNYWSEIIKKERKCEAEIFKNLIVKVPLNKREKEGFAVSNLKAKKINLYLKLAYRFGREREIDTEIKPGDTVIVYPQELEKEKEKEKIIKQGLIGTVESKGKKFLDISFSRKLPKSWNKKKLVVNLFVSDVTFKRMLEALENIKKGKTEFNFNLIFK